MSELLGGTHFLFLRSERPKRKVHCYKRFDDAVAHLDAHSRVSPIFSLNGAPPPQFHPNTPSQLFFLGPIYPGSLPLGEFRSTFLTLGLFNIVVFCATESEGLALANILATTATAWERWDLTGDELDGHECFYARQVPSTASTEPLSGLPSQMLPTARECLGQLRTTAARAALHGVTTVDVLQRFDKGLRRLLSDPRVHDVEKLQFLVTSNVALSRHRWQAYSGTFSIIDNPCHFATHSLLGVGTASLALETLTRFVEKVFDTNDLGARLEALKERDPQARPLVQIPADDTFFREDFLKAEERESAAVETVAPLIPHVTYLSGRDGFRSTPVSLSAPVEALTGCNTPSWTLHTLTHEISHSVVRATLGKLLPNTSDAADLRRVVDLLNHPEKARSLYEQVRSLLTFGILVMKSDQVEENLTPASLALRLKRDGREADEIVTHVFDFLYHYERDPISYVRSLWATWSMIPHIAGRINEYLIRTLCALHSVNMARDQGRDVTFDALVDCLTKVATDFSDAQYVNEALAELTPNRRKYIEELGRRMPLIKFTRHFLYSPEVASPLVGEAEVVGMSYKKLHFNDEPPIKSPLRFVEKECSDKSPDAITAAWILNHLAHGVQL